LKSNKARKPAKEMRPDCVGVATILFAPDEENRLRVSLVCLTTGSGQLIGEPFDREELGSIMAGIRMLRATGKPVVIPWCDNVHQVISLEEAVKDGLIIESSKGGADTPSWPKGVA
jgi:hypothetical protein